MSLGERLKEAREFLRKTQKEMAEAIGTNPQTWRVYESGKSVPGGNALEGLAKLGFNVNWLLTGEGEMRLVTEASAEWWSETFKRIRGDLSIAEIVTKAEFLDHDKFTAAWRAVEDGRIEPDWHFLTVISQELGVSPSWMLDGDGPMFKNDIAHEPKAQSTRYEDLDENGITMYWEEEQRRFNRVSNLIDEYLAKYHLDPVRDKRGNLAMTLFNIFGDKFCDNRDKFLKSTVNSLVRLCIPDEYFANIDEVNFYIASAHHCLAENDMDNARERMMKSAEILNQLSRSEKGKWSDEMKSARNEHLDFISKDAGYTEGLAKLLPLIQSKDSILESDLARVCPDMPQKLISYILFFAAAQGVIERIQKGRSFLVRSKK